MKAPLRPKKAMVYVRLPESIIEQVDTLAYEEALDRSAVIRSIVIKFFRDKKTHADADADAQADVKV
jgi:metal-responsive CopG/Arc/MetJ family transcriptional regulator